MDDLDQTLRIVDGIEVEDRWDEILSRQPTVPLRQGGGQPRRWRTLVVGLVVGAIGVAVAVVAFNGATPAHQRGPASSGSPTPMITARLSRTVGLDATAESIAAADGSTWVVTYDSQDGSGHVVQIDAARGLVKRTIPIDGFAYNVAAGEGAVWVPVERGHGGVSLVRIDAGSGEITGSVPGVSGPVVVDPSGVWAVEGHDVVRIDPSSLALTARIRLRETPFDIAAGGGSVWVLERPISGNGPSGPLEQFDAATAEPMRTVDLSGANLWIAASPDGVWLDASKPDVPGTSGAWFVPRTGGAPVDVASVANFRPFTVALGHVWFISGPSDKGLPAGGVCGLNIATNTIDSCAKPRSIVDLEGAHDALAYDPTTQTLWVGEYESGFVTKIDLVPAPVPAEFSFAEAQDLLAQRDMIVRAIPQGQTTGLLPRKVFDRVLSDWLTHHRTWRVLSVHLGDVRKMPMNGPTGPSWFVEITGPATGNCFYFFNAKDGEETAGACFYAARS